MPARVRTFAQALAETATGKRHLLLGNGFSIALFPDRFRYGFLLGEADFTRCLEARRAFDQLGTTDFEVVIKALRDAVALLPLYSAKADAANRMQEHAESLKELLIQAIAGQHPERPSDITEDQYRACRAFLAHFVGETRDFKAHGGKDCRGNIYTLNYDLLLYWTLLHDQLVDWWVVDWNVGDPLASMIEQTEPLEHDDGFRAPEDDPDAAYVTWEAEGGAASQNIHFLHGGLHLYDDGPELQKRCWEQSGGTPLVDQIRGLLMPASSHCLFPKEIALENLPASAIAATCSDLSRALRACAAVQASGRACLSSVIRWRQVTNMRCGTSKRAGSHKFTSASMAIQPVTTTGR